MATPGRPTADHLPDWHAELTASLTFPLGWKEPCDDSSGWRARGLEAYRLSVGEALEPPPAEALWGPFEEREGYRVCRVELSLGPFRRTPGLLALPGGPGPFPAALVLHDHGACFDIGKEKMLAPLAGHPLAPRARAWAEAQYGGAFVGDELARRGWAVLTTDAYGWGDRACAGYDSQQALASNLLGLGSSWAGVIAAEDAAAALWLSRLPQVDPHRVAAVGHSLGAFRAWQVNALSPAVRAAVAVCSFGTVAGLMVPGGNRVRGQSAFSMTHPGLARVLDFPDMAALAVPKPLLMLHGRDDRLFPAADVARAYEKTASVYRGWGAEGCFSGRWKEGGHEFTRADQEQAWVWLDQALTGAAPSSFLS